MASNRLPGAISEVFVNQTLSAGTVATRKAIVLGVGDVKTLVLNEKHTRGSIAGGKDTITNTLYDSSAIVMVGNSPNSSNWTRTTHWIVDTINNSLSWESGADIPGNSTITQYGSVATGDSSSVFTVATPSNWSAVSGYYVGGSITITNPDSSNYGVTKTISAYNGAGQFTVNPAFANNILVGATILMAIEPDEPAAGSDYYITYYKKLENTEITEYSSEGSVKVAYGDSVMSTSKQYAPITAVVSSAIFSWGNTDTITSPQSNWTIRFTSGANTGLSRTVSTYSGGQFTVSVAFPYTITVGDVFLIENAITPVVNTLTEGALIALRNGASSVTVAPLANTSWGNKIAPTAAEYKTSLDTHLETLKGYNEVPYFMVPMLPDNATTFTTNANVNTYVAVPVWDHCKLMSTPENKGERTMIIGYLSGTAKTSFKSIAPTFFSTRAIVMAPGDIGTTSVAGHTVNGSLLAAAWTGRYCSKTDFRSMLGESLSGITIEASFYNTFDQRELRGTGNTFAIDSNGIVRVVASITTDTTSADTEDPAVVSIADYVKKSTREELGNTFINSPTNDRTMTAIKGKVNTIFSRMISEGVIETFKDVSVKQNLGEPRLIEVTGSVKPLYSIWYIDAGFSFYV